MEKAIVYLTEFFRSRYPHYEEAMREAGTSRGPPKFEGEDAVIQDIRNIVHNIADNYSDITVPRGYATPNLLKKALVSLRDMADQQFQEIESIREAIGHCPGSISAALKMNLEVRDAIDHALTLDASSTAAQQSGLNRLKCLADRLPHVARQLTKRRNENGSPRPTLEIKDEYDVQDLLHSVLRIDFEDIRPEEWCPSYAGASKRTDFLLKKEAIVVEVKKTRTTLKDREVGEQLIIDIANYRNHPECKHLFCLVWDTEHFIQNSSGLASDLEKANLGFVTVKIVS
jgi:REase_DpnII-MboI